MIFLHDDDDDKGNDTGKSETPKQEKRPKNSHYHE